MTYAALSCTEFPVLSVFLFAKYKVLVIDVHFDEQEDRVEADSADCTARFGRNEIGIWAFFEFVQCELVSKWSRLRCSAMLDEKNCGIPSVATPC